MKIRYRQPKFHRRDARVMIKRANDILAEYEQHGLILTLRQLYYQFVARDFIENNVKSYQKLGKIIGDARLAGLVDWERLEDRTRNLKLLEHFNGPQDALDKLASWYHVDMWENQAWRPEVWIEKDALAGVIQKVCEENDVPYFSCRGYTSLSEMWRASMRLRRWIDAEQTPFIIHFGDHDPSGMDMSRDIVSRLQDTFMADCKFERVALNMDQIWEYKPPPNPAKVTDSRYKSYVHNFGKESWELDALEPKKFRELVEEQLVAIRDDKKWEEDRKLKEQTRKKIEEIGREWSTITSNKEQIETLQKRVTALTKRLKRRDSNGRK